MSAGDKSATSFGAVSSSATAGTRLISSITSFAIVLTGMGAALSL